MIRTVITPTKGQIVMDLPKDYIGKKIEIIAFTIEETLQEKTLTQFASEKSLAKEWLTEVEDKAWEKL